MSATYVAYVLQKGRIIYQTPRQHDRSRALMWANQEVKRRGLDPFSVEIEVDESR